jgi:hypothetical protein
MSICDLMRGRNLALHAAVLARLQSESRPPERRPTSASAVALDRVRSAVQRALSRGAIPSLSQLVCLKPGRQSSDLMGPQQNQHPLQSKSPEQHQRQFMYPMLQQLFPRNSQFSKQDSGDG